MPAAAVISKLVETAPRITRQGDKFEAWVGRHRVGYSFIHHHTGGRWTLDSIDVEEAHQRQGYATALVQAIAVHLRAAGATTLSSSNEGSGTVQILDKVFGRDRVKHFHGGEEIPFEEAVEIMDVDFGYTRSEVTL